MPDPGLASAQRTVVKEGLVKITGPGHAALVTRLKPGFLLVTERGLQTAGTRALLIREIEAEIAASAPVTVFIDIRASDRMDGQARDEWGSFGKRRHAAIARVNVLVKSRLLEMAFSVMGLFVGGGTIRVVANPEDMLREIQRAVPSFTALPVVNG